MNEITVALNKKYKEDYMNFRVEFDKLLNQEKDKTRKC